MSKEVKDWLFWCVGAIFTLICVVAVPALATNMITNDRIRSSEDQRLEKTISYNSIQIAKLIECSENIKADLSEIKILLRRAVPAK
jgi:hypothetical protein